MKSRETFRQARAVLDDHLARRLRGDLEGDLRDNYAPEVVVLSKDGAYHGHEGVRQTATMLAVMLPDAAFTYDLVRVESDYGLLLWSGRASDGAATCDGVDSFVVRDGRIIAQTICYTVRRNED
jgi:hypothetical protein